MARLLIAGADSVLAEALASRGCDRVGLGNAYEGGFYTGESREKLSESGNLENGLALLI